MTQPNTLRSAPQLRNAECGHKRTCSQMTSCEEAMIYMTRCGLSRLDGDGDAMLCIGDAVALACSSREHAHRLRRRHSRRRHDHRPGCTEDYVVWVALHCVFPSICVGKHKSAPSQQRGAYRPRLCENRSASDLVCEIKSGPSPDGALTNPTETFTYRQQRSGKRTFRPVTSFCMYRATTALPPSLP